MRQIKILQGNTTDIAMPIEVRVIVTEDGVTTITTNDYVHEDGDEVLVTLKGARTYNYIPTFEDNIANFTLTGTEISGIYNVEVSVVRGNERMRYAAHNVIELCVYADECEDVYITSCTLDTAIFIRGEKGDKGDKGEPGAQGEQGDKGEPGNGIVSIEKTSTQENVDTYTITYTDGDSSTFEVTNGINGTNGQNGQDGADGADGVSITSVVQTTTSHESGGENIITVTLSNGAKSTFSVYNGEEGEVELIEVSGATPTQELLPNKFYKFTGSVTALTLTLGTAITGITNIYAFSFVAGAANPTISLPASVTIDGTPSIAAGDYVEFNIMN